MSANQEQTQALAIAIGVILELACAYWLFGIVAFAVCALAIPALAVLALIATVLHDNYKSHDPQLQLELKYQWCIRADLEPVEPPTRWDWFETRLAKELREDPWKPVSGDKRDWLLERCIEIPCRGCGRAHIEIGRGRPLCPSCRAMATVPDVQLNPGEVVLNARTAVTRQIRKQEHQQRDHQQ